MTVIAAKIHLLANYESLMAIIMICHGVKNDDSNFYLLIWIIFASRKLTRKSSDVNLFFFYLSKLAE